MKRKKLRSPVKAIHEALACVSLAVGNPLCVQPAKTESFRDLLASFNSVYYTPRVSSSSSSSNTGCRCHGGISHRRQQFPVDVHGVSCGKEEEEEVVSISAATASTSTCSSCVSSSCVTAVDSLDAAEDLPKGAINSRRFFFTPCASKFMTGESLLTVAGSQLAGHPFPGGPEEAEEEDGASDVSPETTDVETVLEDTSTTTEASTLCEQSIPVALASMDPYGDFRNSMEEMVAAHGLRDWPSLQELLRCYLRLNHRKTHRLIVLAFTDLLMHLASQGKIHKSVMHDIFSTSPSPSPHPHPC